MLNKKIPRIVFFGSDKCSVLVLNQLVNDKRFKIAGIVTTEANPKGRKRQISPNPVEEYARVLFDIKFFPIKKFDPKAISRFKRLKADVGVLAWYGKILPKEILAIPKHGALNIHPSLLPAYRGPSPVQAAIANGDKVTGVTIIKMDEKMDHGPIVAQLRQDLKPLDTAESLYERLFTLGAGVLITILPAYLKGQIKLREQDHKKATFTKLLTRDDGKIDWKKKDREIERFIRAMHPWPGSWTYVQLSKKAKVKSKKRLKILKAYLEKGKLVLDRVQLEGKKPVTWKQFCQGYLEAKIIK